ncbi:MAG TPA: Rhs element Vgr protein, partial [Verrucomicrobiales bacterium]|nr:Rhs element Vgr protein [Verrucomicrobiales bacterium]
MSVVTATILSGGKVMDPTYELVSIDVRREVDRIPSANLMLLDGDAPQRVFPISDMDFFEPGKEIEIKLRYEGEPGGDQTVFKGMVIRHGVESRPPRSFLTVELKDAAVRLTQGRRSKVFRDQTDDQAIGAILAAAGLKKGAVAKADPQQPELVQYHCTDWDFILSRADFHGLRVVV